METKKRQFGDKPEQIQKCLHCKLPDCRPRICRMKKKESNTPTKLRNRMSAEEYKTVKNRIITMWENGYSRGAIANALCEDRKRVERAIREYNKKIANGTANEQ